MTSQEFAVAAGDPPADEHAAVRLDTPEPAAPADDLGTHLATLNSALAAVRQEIRDVDERAAGRERLVERLHEDNQKLRAGERRLVLLPVLTDLQRLRNDLLRQAAALRGEENGEWVADLLDSYAHSVELTLERGGVDVVRPGVGDAFDGSRHRPCDVVAAAAPEDDGTVAAVLADGYADTQTGRVLTPATVRVRRWTAPTPQPGEDTHV